MVLPIFAFMNKLYFNVINLIIKKDLNNLKCSILLHLELLRGVKTPLLTKGRALPRDYRYKKYEGCLFWGELEI